MYQWRKGIAQWRVADTLYLSVPFTWLLPEARNLAQTADCRVIAGGPAVDLMPKYLAGMTESGVPVGKALAMHNPLATRTSEGCPNACPFCINQTKALRELTEWESLPVVIDDNFLATSATHQEEATLRLAHLPIVDFNQGLQASLFRGDAITRLQRLHLRLRFAWDDVRSEVAVMGAIGRAKAAGLRDIRCYVLVGYNDTPEDARYRCETLDRAGVMPNPMRFQPLDALAKNSHVGDGWTNPELIRFCRYWAQHSHTAGVPYEEFDDRRTARALARLSQQRLGLEATQ